MKAQGFLAALLRIMFARGSPERILYDRKLLIVGLILALLVSAAAQWFFFGDHLVFMILRVFAELTMFMLWMTLLTAKVARLRLAGAMLCLIWICLLGDVLLLLLAPIMPLLAGSISPQTLGLLVAVVLAYGSASVTAWALRKPLTVGALHVLLYGVAVIALDITFRRLFEMAAG
ncbi:MAG: hypothetical protein AAF529_15655 [Pseudomonadota bacterium]